MEEGGDASAACRELILEAAAKWNEEEEGDYRDDITCMVVRVNPLKHLKRLRSSSNVAFLPAAADEIAGERRPGERERTSNLTVPQGRSTVVLDTKGTGRVDTVGVDTTGDGVADTFYPAKAVDTTGQGEADVLEINTAEPRKASNVIGGQEGARESQKLAFEKKKALIESLVKSVDEALIEEESPRSGTDSNPASPAPGRRGLGP